jgi:hypothetical protein
MAKREISNLDLKIKLTNEYLRNGGVEKIPSKRLLEDLLKVKFGPDGKADPDSVSTTVNAFMLAILADHMMPPFFHTEHISEYQSTLQKSNSFTQTNIDTEEEFDKIYEEYKNKADHLFRGQREAKWRLYSTLQRHWIWDNWLKKDISYQTLLENMIKLGQDQFGDDIKGLLKEHHIDSLNSISIMGYLQHHGCPTPLLDWTYDFKCALYFALDGIEESKSSREIEEYCSVYHIEEKYLEGSNVVTIMTEAMNRLSEPILENLINQIAGEDDAKRAEMMEKFKGRSVYDPKRIPGSGLINHITKIEHLMQTSIGYFSDRDAESGIIFSLDNSQNIKHQSGVFIWNNDPSRSLELVGDEWAKEMQEDPDEDLDYNFCSCFNIKKSLADYALKKLETDGITKEYIYPTPDLSTRTVYDQIKTH